MRTHYSYPFSGNTKLKIQSLPNIIRLVTTSLFTMKESSMGNSHVIVDSFFIENGLSASSSSLEKCTTHTWNNNHIYHMLDTVLTPSLVSQMVKNLSGMQETQVWTLGWEDPLEKGKVMHFRILAWRIPWTEEPGGLQSMGSQRVKTWLSEQWLTLFQTYLSINSSNFFRHQHNETYPVTVHVFCWAAEAGRGLWQV